MQAMIIMNVDEYEKSSPSNHSIGMFSYRSESCELIRNRSHLLFVIDHFAGGKNSTDLRICGNVCE